MTTVVDASVAFKFAVEEEGAGAALDLLAREPDIVAPDLILTELANAFWAAVRRSELLEVHAHDNLVAMPGFLRRLWATGSLVTGALELSFRLRHPIYDCTCLALARREGVPLVTADKKFFNKVAASPFGASVKELGA